MIKILVLLLAIISLAPGSVGANGEVLPDMEVSVLPGECIFEVEETGEIIVLTQNVCEILLEADVVTEPGVAIDDLPPGCIFIITTDGTYELVYLTPQDCQPPDPPDDDSDSDDPVAPDPDSPDDPDHDSPVAPGPDARGPVTISPLPVYRFDMLEMNAQTFQQLQSRIDTDIKEPTLRDPLAAAAPSVVEDETESRAGVLVGAISMFLLLVLIVISTVWMVHKYR